MDKAEFMELMRGPAVVVLTPFNGTGKKLNETGLRENVRFMIDKGIKKGSGVLIPGGSVGDCFVMTVEERKRTFEIVIDEAKGEVPVICGINHTGTDIVIELAQYAESIGADGVMLTPPYYWISPSEESIFTHYKEVSDSINIGIMIYNNPNIVNMDFSVEFLLKLSKLENIAAIKECTPFMTKYKRVVENLSDKMAVINGIGEQIEPLSYRMGTKSYTSGFANFLPSLCVELHENAIKGNYEKAEKIIENMRPLQNIMDRYMEKVGLAQGLRLFKEMANMAGFPMGPPRTPILPVSSSVLEELKQAMAKMKPEK